jgi:hypothetical protein
MNFKKYLWGCGITIAATLFIITKSFGQYEANSRVYYVSLYGDDTNPGTIEDPFKTINKVNDLHLMAGDTVYFKSGQVFNGNLLITNETTGTQDKPIVITSYGGKYATINANDSIGININKGAFLKLQHIAILGSGRKTGNTENGIEINHCTRVLIEDLNISGFQKSGLVIYSSQNIEVKNVFAHDNGFAGITVESQYPKKESRDIKILNCRAENNPGDPTNLTNHSGNGIIVGNCINILIDHCTATNNGWDMPRIGNGPVGIWAYEADSIIIQHCLSYRNKTSKGGADGGGFDLDGGVTNSVIEYCLSYDNQGAGYCIFQYRGASNWHHNIFRYNISENDGTVSDAQAGLYIWNSSDDEMQFHDCEVYGNIIYNARVAAIRFSDKSGNSDFRFYNNIFVGKDLLLKGKDKIGQCAYSRNDWWSLESGFNIDGIKDLKAWAIKTGNEQNDGEIIGLNVKPGFKKPGNALITSASQLAKFKNYQLSKKSLIKLKSIYIPVDMVLTN